MNVILLYLPPEIDSGALIAVMLPVTLLVSDIFIIVGGCYFAAVRIVFW
jgi:hypothetical protein